MPKPAGRAERWVEYFLKITSYRLLFRKIYTVVVMKRNKGLQKKKLEIFHRNLCFDPDVRAFEIFCSIEQHNWPQKPQETYWYRHTVDVRQYFTVRKPCTILRKCSEININ